MSRFQAPPPVLPLVLGGLCPTVRRVRLSRRPEVLRVIGLNRHSPNPSGRPAHERGHVVPSAGPAHHQRAGLAPTATRIMLVVLRPVPSPDSRSRIRTAGSARNPARTEGRAGAPPGGVCI